MRFPEWLFVVDLAVDTKYERALNRWYDEVHLPEIVDCPGFIEGARYIAPTKERDSNIRRHLTLYQIEGPDSLLSGEFSRRRGLGEFNEAVELQTRLYKKHLERPK